jgi:hypothetical protein
MLPRQFGMVTYNELTGIGAPQSLRGTRVAVQFEILQTETPDF